MKHNDRFRWEVVLLLAVLAVVTLAAMFPIKSGAPVVNVGVRPPSQWRVGFHHVEVCKSPNPMMVGWNLNLGPLSVSRLQPWQSSLVGHTNLIVPSAKFPTQTNATWVTSTNGWVDLH